MNCQIKKKTAPNRNKTVLSIVPEYAESYVPKVLKRNSQLRDNNYINTGQELLLNHYEDVKAKTIVTEEECKNVEVTRDETSTVNANSFNTTSVTANSLPTNTVPANSFATNTDNKLSLRTLWRQTVNKHSDNKLSTNTATLSSSEGTCGGPAYQKEDEPGPELEDAADTDAVVEENHPDPVIPAIVVHLVPNKLVTTPKPKRCTAAIKSKTVQADLIDSIKQKPLVLGGDRRCDTPGHNAKYCTYSMMDLESNKVLEIWLIQFNEVKSSCHIELEGLERCLEFLEFHCMAIQDIVTDRHVMVKKYLRKEHSTKNHYFDVWHVAKGSKPHKMMKQVVESTYLLRDIPKLSPCHQTYRLEVYHSVVNHFAPKSTHFFHNAMLARYEGFYILVFSALHYNENSGRVQACTKTGKAHWKVSWPNAKKGVETVVKPTKVDPTFGYVKLVRQKVVARRMEVPSYRQTQRDNVHTMAPVPPPLTFGKQPKGKEELVRRHKSIFAVDT
ncbi:hypothetical protein ScPMuIL_001684 [Solemya velum]